MQIVKSINIHEGPSAKYSYSHQEQSVLQLSLCGTNCSAVFFGRVNAYSVLGPLAFRV